MSPRKKKPSYIPVKRGIGRVFGFGILSLGLYSLYWFYVTRKELSKELKQADNAGLQTLGLLVPILNLFITYWLYRDLEACRKKINLDGFSASGCIVALIILYVVSFVPMLEVFGLGVLVVYGIVIQKLNEYWDKKYKGRATAAKVTAAEVVLSLGGLLVIGFIALIFAALGSAQDGARDSQRKSDLNQYKTALILYQADKGKYPSSATVLVPDYIIELPKDPNGNNYRYVTNGKSFNVCADLERNAGYRFEVGPSASQEVMGLAVECRVLP